MSGDDTTVVVDAPVPFGIDAESGCPLPALQTGDLAALASIATVRPYETVLERRADPGMEGHFGVLGELDPMALDETGWGVIIASDIPGNVKDGLEPLLARRRDQAGHLFKLFEGPDAPRPGESVAKWLGRHGASMQSAISLHGDQASSVHG